MIKFNLNLKIQFLEQGVRRNDAILKYHNVFDDTGQTIAFFQMTNTRFDRTTAEYSLSVTVKGQNNKQRFPGPEATAFVSKGPSGTGKFDGDWASPTSRRASWRTCYPYKPDPPQLVL